MFYCSNCILHPVLGYLPDLQEKRTGGIFPGRNSAVLHSYPDSSAFYVTDKKQPEPALSVNGMDDFRTPVFLYQPQTDSVCTEKSACILSVSAGNFLLYSFRQSESHVPDYVCTDGALHGGQTASEKEHRKGGFFAGVSIRRCRTLPLEYCHADFFAARQGCGKCGKYPGGIYFFGMSYGNGGCDGAGAGAWRPGCGGASPLRQPHRLLRQRDNPIRQ